MMTFLGSAKDVLIDFERVSEVIIELIVYRNSNRKLLSPSTSSSCVTQTIICASKSCLIQLYSTLSLYGSSMGNPSAIEPLENFNNPKTSLSSADSTMSSTDSTLQMGKSLSIKNISADNYQFGTANSIQCAHSKLSDKEILRVARESFRNQNILLRLNDSKARNEFQKDLDKKVWQLITNWRNNHFIFHPSRCLGCLIINYSPNHVQLTDVKLKEGENFEILGIGSSYDSDSRTLLASGSHTYLHIIQLGIFASYVFYQLRWVRSYFLIWVYPNVN